MQQGKWIKRFFFVIVIVLGALLFTRTPMMQWLETNLIFFPSKRWDFHPKTYQLTFEDVTIKTNDEVLLSGWFFPTDSKKPVILFLHGNAGNISHRLDKIKPLVVQGYPVFIIDYRGFGKSEGKINEKGTYLDARTAYDYLTQEKKFQPDQIILYGESIGSAIAIDLATRVSIGGLILEAPFTRVADMAKTHYPFIPTSFLKTKYDSLSKITSIHSPLLILHGNEDEIVPYKLGKELFEAANEPKTFYTIDGGTHNESFLIGGGEFWKAIFKFLETK